MGWLSILSVAQRLVEQGTRPGDKVIDATAGNGVDTCFLAKIVGNTGVVHSFDIQRQALEQTRLRLQREGWVLDEQAARAEMGDAARAVGLPNIQLHLASHADMLRRIPNDQHGKFAAIMFNLGYLPGSDQATVTIAEHTIPALDSAAKLLRPDGVITVAIYTGHEGGMEEARAVEAWAAALPQQYFDVIRYQFVNRLKQPPYLIAVKKQPGSLTDIRK